MPLKVHSHRVRLRPCTSVDAHKCASTDVDGRRRVWCVNAQAFFHVFHIGVDVDARDARRATDVDGRRRARCEWVLSVDVSLRPGHVILHGDAAVLKRGTSPMAIFGPCLFWPKRRMYHDVTWYEGRPRSMPYCVRWGPSFPRKGHSSHPLFGHVYCGQTTGWIKVSLGTEVGLGPSHIVLDGKPAPS